MTKKHATYTREEYLELFPVRKRLARGALLSDAAQRAAASINKRIKDAHGDDGAISSLVGRDEASLYVDEYVEKVIDFKIKNGLPPKNRIEAPKIASILVTHLYTKEVNELFSFDENYKNSMYPAVVRGTLFNRITYACLGLPKSFINEALGQDLHRVLVTEDVSNKRLMSVLFKGVFWARGVEADCLED